MDEIGVIGMPAGHQISQNENKEKNDGELGKELREKLCLTFFA